MDLSLKNKRAIVCGSTQGIGLATAKELADLGASITLVARNEEKLSDVVKTLFISPEQQHNYVVADFNRPEELRAAILAQLREIPEADILVNNTGGPPSGAALEATPDEFIKAFTSHLICNQLLVQATVPYMKEKGFGRIINIISTSVKAPIPGLGVSNTTRGAVANWSKTLSLELAGFGITVNNVLPGATYTGRLQSLIDNKARKLNRQPHEIAQEMMEEIPSGRFAVPEEVAAAVAFLATPAASYINGINIPVDGGRTPSL